MPYNFFQNKECEWFPCHKTNNTDEFSCLFCYCPLYPFDECGGNYKKKGGIKDCSECLIPHYNYLHVIKKLVELYKFD